MDNNNQAKHKIVQTYAEDMAQVLEDDKGGLIKKIIHNEEEHEKEKRNLSPESKKNKFFMLLGIFFMLGSIATLLFFFFKRDVPSVSVQKQFIPIIFTDKNALVEVVDLKKDEIAKKVLNEINKSTVKVGGIEGIYLTLNKAPVGLRKFIESIEGNFPQVEGNFIEDNFLLGVYKNKEDLSVSTKNNFFMLIKMRSIPDVFDIMHTWENKMFTDLHGFFGIDFTPETKPLITKNFEDGIIENKNARILYSEDVEHNKKIVLAYIFADDNSIVITNSENVVKEIIARLGSGQVKK